MGTTAGVEEVEELELLDELIELLNDELDRIEPLLDELIDDDSDDELPTDDDGVDEA